jgi:hypothetical protein
MKYVRMTAALTEREEAKISAANRAGAFLKAGFAVTAMLIAGSTSAAAQSAGCSAIDGFMSNLVQVRVTEVLTQQPFNAGEVIRLNASSVVSRETVGTAIWAFADTSAGFGFSAGAISPFFVSSNSPVSESVTIPSGGIAGLALTETGPISTDLAGVSISCGGGASGADSVIAAVGSSARLIVIGADGVARDAGQVSIAARNDRIELTRVADGTGAGDVTVSTSGVPGMMGNLYTWAEVTGFRSEDFGSGDGTIGGGGLQIGADIEIGADMVAGVSIGYSQINAEDAGTTTEGNYAYLQPYFAYRSGAWHGSASVILGAGQFEQNGGADRADVTLAAATFEGGYDYALNDMFTLTPTIGLLHGREEIDGTDGALAGTSSDSAFSQLSLGGRITHSGAQGTLFAGLHADYLTSSASSVLAEDLLQDDGWTGRVEVGGEVALSNGMDLSTSVELSGLGGMQTVSGGLTVALRF